MRPDEKWPHKTHEGKEYMTREAEERSLRRCATCRHWDPNPSDGSWDVDYGECRRLVAARRPYPPATAWAAGPEVDGLGFATTAAFGCTEYQPTEEPK